MEEREEKEDQLPNDRQRTADDNKKILESIENTINTPPIRPELKKAYREECEYLQKILSALDKAREKYIKDNQQQKELPKFMIASAGCGKNPVEFVVFKAYLEYFKIPYLCVGIDANRDHILEASSTFNTFSENIKFYYGDISKKEVFQNIYYKLFQETSTKKEKEKKKEKISGYVDLLHLGHPPVFIGLWLLKFLIPQRDKHLTDFSLFLHYRIQEILKPEGTIISTHYNEEEHQALKNKFKNKFSFFDSFRRKTNPLSPFPRCAVVNGANGYTLPAPTSPSAEADERYYYEMRQWLRYGLFIGLLLCYIAYQCEMFSIEKNTIFSRNHRRFG